VLVIVSYLMRKFKWGLGKSLELVALKRPDINPNPGLLSAVWMLSVCCLPSAICCPMFDVWCLDGSPRKL
jgi:hypothetical protein